jgi:type 2 lantibiotic biosynthesis protein LanM
LEGETPQARFSFFASCLRDAEFARGVLAQYPVLVRQATIAVRHWRAALTEFAERLVLDAPEIARTLFTADTMGRLTHLRLSAGDSHRKGRSVIVAEFDDGAHTVVYKPRSLAVDRCFSNLITWFNGLGHQPELVAPRILERGDYGWVEYIATAPCTDEREVELFYRRQGANVALVYLLKGTDLHSENIIAAGSQPILLDLEALFHPTFRASAVSTATSLVQAAIDRSAVATGILPVRPPRATREDEWLDMSGMSGAAERRVPFELPAWIDFDSDEMRMQLESTTLEPDNNLPVLNGRLIGPGAYADAIMDGFTDAYQLVCANRGALLGSDGVLAAFADVDVRMIARNTARYEQILHDSYDPKFLASVRDREGFLDTLWTEVETNPVLEKLHRAERADLWNCDIPFFVTKPASLTLWSSAGGEILGPFQSTSMQEVINRIENAGSRDLALQSFMVRAALAEPAHGITRRPLATHGMACSGTEHETQPYFLARHIGEHLLATAIRESGGANWIVLEENERGHGVTAPASSDLYSGLPGIALFLFALADATADQRFEVLAHEAVTELSGLVADDNISELGGFTGLPGVCYALAECGRHHRSQVMQAAADRLRHRSVFAEAKETDIISGLAGSILALLAAWRKTNNALLRDRALTAGKVLYSRVAPDGPGFGKYAPEERAAARGLGHGSIGHALAFARLGVYTEERLFTEAAAALCRLELSRLDSDLRASVEEGAQIATSWCNGASGLLVALLEITHLLPEIQASESMRRLLEIVLRQTDEASDCLCHGSVGTCLIVQRASARGFLDPAVAAVLRRRTISRMAALGVASGTVAGLHAPGLMDGLSGIGLGLLEMHHPGTTVDVLTLN